MTFTAKTGMDIAFAAIFVLAIGLQVTNETVTNLTTALINGTATITGITATIVEYGPLIVGAGFLYGVARISRIL